MKYSYIEHPVQVDGKTYWVTVDIRQSQQKNKFWMHKDEINENGQSLMVSAADAVKYPNEELPNDNVPQERQSVKGSRDLQKQIDALERQNKRLKEQMKRTDVPKVRREVVKRSAKDVGIISIECDCEPYKYKLQPTIVSVAVNGTSNIILANRLQGVVKLKIHGAICGAIVVQFLVLCTLQNVACTRQNVARKRHQTLAALRKNS